MSVILKELTDLIQQLQHELPPYTSWDEVIQKTNEQHLLLLIAHQNAAEPKYARIRYVSAFLQATCLLRALADLDREETIITRSAGNRAGGTPHSPPRKRTPSKP